MGGNLKNKMSALIKGTSKNSILFLSCEATMKRADICNPERALARLNHAGPLILAIQAPEL